MNLDYLEVKKLFLTCFPSSDHCGVAGDAASDGVHCDYIELVLGVGAEAAHRVVHGDHPRDLGEGLVRELGLVLDHVVLDLLLLRVRPGQTHRRRRHLQHLHRWRRRQRCANTQINLI